MFDELTKLLKHTTIYGLGTVLGKMIGFFMIPFYTHYLSPADYGTLELLDLSASLIGLVLTMWLNASVIRHYNDFSGARDRRQAISTIMTLAFVIGIAVALSGSWFSRPLSALILNNESYHSYVTLEAVLFLVNSIYVVCLSYMRARQLSVLVVGSSLASLVLSLFLNIYFIGIRHVGVVGVLYSSLLAGTLITIVLAVYTVKEIGIGFSYGKLRTVVAFGAPLMLTSATGFVVNFSDRFFLRHFSTLSTVGVYALGYKFGLMLSLLIVQPFDMIWQARLYDIGKRDQSGQTFARLFEYYCFVLVAAALALSVGIKELLFVISPPEFHGAYAVVPVVAAAYIFQGANRFFLAGTYIAKKTLPLGAVGLVCAGANIGLNLLWIPRHGMLGAAWATLVSFLLMSALAWYVSQRAYHIPYVFSRVVVLLACGTLLYVISLFVNVRFLGLQLFLKCCLLAVFPIALYLAGFFSRQEVDKGKALAYQILGRYSLLSAADSGR